MNKLIVFYDSKLANEGTKSYMKAIKSKIEDVAFVDIWGNTIPNIDFYPHNHKALVLQPMDIEFYALLLGYLSFYSSIDIEHITNWNSEQTTLTAQAIYNEVRDRIIEPNRNNHIDYTEMQIDIVNKSNVLGKPLECYLRGQGFTNVRIYGSKDILDKDTFKDTDILITATGNQDFKMDNDWVKHIPLVIDLSHDTTLEKAVRRVKTVDELVRRLEKWKN